MKRKIMTLALIVSLIMMSIGTMVDAASKVNITLAISKSTIEQGDTFTLSVILSEGNVKSYDIKVLFDPSDVECISNSESGITLGSNYVIVSKSSTSNNLSGDNVANINFRAKENASIGTTTFAIDSSSTVIERLNEGDVTGSINSNVTINIKEKYIASSNSNLSSLELDVGTLTPSFDKDITSYSVTVEYDVETINLSAKAENLKVSNVSITGNKKLVDGDNLYTIIVTAEDGSTKKYELNVIRKKDSRSSNTNLKTLKANRNNVLSSKSLTVKNNVSSVEIVAETEDEKSKISGDLGIKDLNVGKNIFKLTVTAENGDVETYEFTVTRSEADGIKTPSANASLRSLLVDGTEVTGFSSATHTYEVRVDKNKTTAVISAVKDDENAILSGIGTVSLDYGTNTFTVRVIAENGKTNNIYILNIMRGGKATATSAQSDEENVEVQTEEIKPESNNYLKSLEINQGVISPEFNKAVSAYSTVVGMDVDKINVIAMADYEKATVEVIGNTDLVEGLNNITIMVTAEDGTKRVYTISVTKTDNLELANANLQSIAIDGIELLPEFNPNVLEYTCYVEENVTLLDVVALATRSNAKVEITGNENLVPGENIINIIVTAEDGITTKTYVVKVMKAGSLDDDLKNEIPNKAQNVHQEANLSKEEKNNTGIVVAFIIATYSVGILAMCLLYMREKELSKSPVSKLSKGKDEANKDNNPDNTSSNTENNEASKNKEKTEKEDIIDEKNKKD